MKFEESFLDEVKARHRLSEYIGRSVPLKRAGREFKGLSPFVKERTPSFFVNDDKGFWHDFSSGRHGDLIAFVQETEGLTFVEAVHRLAEEAGLALPSRDPRALDAERRRKGLHEILDLTAAWFQGQLHQSADARAYLERRGLTDWAQFGIGYAPADRTALLAHLRGKGVSPAQAVEAGVAIQPEDGRSPLDRFRHRIIFPIQDPRGRLISFGGRALDPGERAKYLNGPDTPIFDKGRNLYGLHMAKRLLAAGSGPLTVSEGYMDVIACLRAGVAACAPMGTALTESQLELLWRHHPSPTLCFDADAAGRRAAHRALDLALPKISSGRSLRFVSVTGGKDPDDVLREQGADALRAQMSGGIPFAEMIFQRERDAAPLTTPEERAAFKGRLRTIVRTIGDRDLAKEYGEEFKARLDTLFARGPRQEAPAAPATVDAAKSLREAPLPAMSALAFWAVRDPARVSEQLETFEAHGFGHEALDRMAGEIVAWMMATADLSAEQLAQRLHARGYGPLMTQLRDPGEGLRDATRWGAVYATLVEYLGLCRAVQQARDDGRMQDFAALKGRRDAAKRALAL